MSDINVNYQMLGEQGTVIKKINSEIQEELKKIKEEIGSTNTIWKSPAQSVLESKFNGIDNKVTQFYDELNGYADFLIKTAEAYGFVEKKIQKNADNFMD